MIRDVLIGVLQGIAIVLLAVALIVAMIALRNQAICDPRCW